MARIFGITGVSFLEGSIAAMAEGLAAPKNFKDWYSLARDRNSGLGGIGWENRAFTYEDSRFSIVWDGPIYNLEELGGYSDLGHYLAKVHDNVSFEEAMAALNGDCSVALLDKREGVFWLGRDRFGVKPLYYFWDERQFAFASRLRSLLAVPSIPVSVRNSYVARVLGTHYRYFDNHLHESPFEGISQLPAAHILSFDGKALQLREYWALLDRPDFSEGECELADRYRELFIDSVKRRCRYATDKMAFTLSGGMDSSSVLASAVKVTGRKQHAYSTVYVDKTYDESEEIASMLEENVSQWHKLVVNVPDVYPLLKEMIQVHDEPVATATWLSHYLLCKEASSNGVDAFFGGLGGDELNAGEFEYFPYFFADLRLAGDESVLDREVSKWIEFHDHPVFKKNRAVMETNMKKLVSLPIPGRTISDWDRLYRYADVINPDFYPVSQFQPILDHPFRSFLKNRSFQDLHRETLPPCLRAQERQSAAFGMDNFLPFLDHRLVEFMFRVPGTMKYKNGVTKHLLREAMRGVLPEATRTRVKKTGWNAPAHVWFSGQGRTMLLDFVHSANFRQRGIYNVPKVIELIEEHDHIVRSGAVKDHHMMFLWQLVNIEIWFESLTGVKARGLNNKNAL